MSFILLVNILLSEEDFQALQKEPFRNSCDLFVIKSSIYNICMYISLVSVILWINMYGITSEILSHSDWIFMNYIPCGGYGGIHTEKALSIYVEVAGLFHIDQYIVQVGVAQYLYISRYSAVTIHATEWHWNLRYALLHSYAQLFYNASLISGRHTCCNRS